MPGHALEHYLEHAATEHLPRFETWFPSSFDWRRLCSDVPGMVRTAGHEVSGLERERRLEEMAAAVFQAAHLLSIALLAASAEGTEDPEELLQRLAERPDVEEEDAFDDLVADLLAEVEERLAASDFVSEDGSDDATEAMQLVRIVTPAVHHAMATDASGTFEEAGDAADVLWGVARVATILAAFRWMAAEREAEDWPSLPLDGPLDDSLDDSLDGPLDD